LYLLSLLQLRELLLLLLQELLLFLLVLKFHECRLVLGLLLDQLCLKLEQGLLLLQLLRLLELGCELV
jgi:hypothetical protein